MSEPSFRTGQRIPHDGLYRVFHDGHVLPSEVTLREGELFPCCAGCAEDVIFRLLRPLVLPDGRGAFRVVLHQLPVLDSAKTKAA